jgi:hypothetical protein
MRNKDYIIRPRIRNSSPCFSDGIRPNIGSRSEPHGILTVPLRTPGGIVALPIHVVPQNVPLLTGTDILDAQQWYIRNVTDELVSPAGWTADYTIARALLVATRFR